jgi:hypothetical protein
VTKLAWDTVGNRLYETGVDRGVLYIPDGTGAYVNGYAWNGLTKITEKPTGAAANPQYADNIKYLNLISTEEFDADVEAFTYPDAWGQCDGSASPEAGVSIGQQRRTSFGLSYRTKVGNDLVGTAYGYKLHLIYNALAAPSQKAFETVNNSPKAIALAWSISTTPVDVPGYDPTATLTIDSTKVDATALANLENLLYGTVGTNPSLPAPAAVLALFAGTVTQVTPVAPTYNSSTHTITIPTVTGITYSINGVAVTTSTVVITTDTVVVASPNTGYKFPLVTDNDWLFTYV